MRRLWRRHFELTRTYAPGRAMLVPLAFLAGVGCTVRQPTTTRAVEIRGFEYVPTTVTARAGDTLAWTNGDLVPHTVTAEGQGLDSGSIDAQQTWRYVAERAGTYAYVCAFHPNMRGTVVVR